MDNFRKDKPEDNAPPKIGWLTGSRYAANFKDAEVEGAEKNICVDYFSLFNLDINIAFRWYGEEEVRHRVGRMGQKDWQVRARLWMEKNCGHCKVWFQRDGKWAWHTIKEANDFIRADELKIIKEFERGERLREDVLVDFLDIPEHPFI